MNKYDKELIKTTPSMVKGIVVETERLHGDHTITLSLKDVCGMAEFGLALCGQIVDDEKESIGKVIVKCTIGGALIGSLITLFVANRICKQDTPTTNYTISPLPNLDNGALEAKINSLQRLYQHG